MKSKTIVLVSILMITTYAAAFSGLGSGTETDPYIITTLQQLQEMRDDLLASYVLGNDIDASATSDWNGGAGFVPIGPGSNNNYFRGHFNGNGHVITGLYINRPNSGKVGLFGYMTGGGIVENVGLTNARVSGDYYIGTLVGICSGNSLIDNCWASGQVTISADGSSETKSGGLIGVVWSSVLSRSYSNVAVTALSSRRQVGGLCGNLRGRSGNPDAIIENCYSTGTVTANGFKVGGLLGDADGVNALVSNCYSVGKVNGASIYKKGLVGFNYNNPTIRDSYWDLQTSGCSTSWGGVGKTTAQMMQQNTFASWDFVGEDTNGTEDIWFMRDGIEYPRLTALNHMPSADAGSEITAYAGPDGTAMIKLDGSGSYDPDGDTLEYFWYEDGAQIAEGEDPNVIFTIGEHVIDLVVNDGNLNSEPDSVIVTVLEMPNSAPVADAGDDILAYAGADGLATVQLDGLGSSDEDGDALEYFWFNDANELIAKGEDPNVVLAEGVHVIELIVDDGELSSEPNSVVVTVIEAIEAVAYVFPRVLNAKSRGRYVIARMELPDGVSTDDVESDSLVLIIGNTIIETVRQRRISSRGQDYVFGFFDRGRVIAQADGKTKLDIVIAGELTTGQCVYGEDSIKIVKSQAPPQKTLRRRPARNNKGGRRGR